LNSCCKIYCICQAMSFFFAVFIEVVCVYAQQIKSSDFGLYRYFKVVSSPIRN
jgi:hypothetical protein